MGIEDPSARPHIFIPCQKFLHSARRRRVLRGTRGRSSIGTLPPTMAQPADPTSPQGDTQFSPSLHRRGTPSRTPHRLGPVLLGPHARLPTTYAPQLARPAVAIITQGMSLTINRCPLPSTLHLRSSITESSPVNQVRPGSPFQIPSCHIMGQLLR